MNSVEMKKWATDAAAAVDLMIEAGPVVWDGYGDGSHARRIVRVVSADRETLKAVIEDVSFVDRDGDAIPGGDLEKWSFYELFDWLGEDLNGLVPAVFAGYRLVKVVRDAKTNEIRTTRKRVGKIYPTEDKVRGKKGWLKDMDERMDPWLKVRMRAESEFGEIWPARQEKN